MKKVSKYTAAQKLEHAELAMAKQDIDAARECMRDAAELAPQVAGMYSCVQSWRQCNPIEFLCRGHWCRIMCGDGRRSTGASCVCMRPILLKLFPCWL